MAGLGALSLPRELLARPGSERLAALPASASTLLQLSGTFFHPKFLGRARFLAGPRRRHEAGRDAWDPPRPALPRTPRSPTPGSASCPVGPAPVSAARGSAAAAASRGRGRPAPRSASARLGGVGLPGRPRLARGSDSGVPLQWAGVGQALSRGAGGKSRGVGGDRAGAGLPAGQGLRLSQVFQEGRRRFSQGWGPEPALLPRLHRPGTHFRARVYTAH